MFYVLTDTLGYLRFSNTGNRIPVMGLFINTGQFEDKIIYEYKRVGEVVNMPKWTLTWPGGGTEVPLDGPKCGWNNEKCMKTSG